MSLKPIHNSLKKHLYRLYSPASSAPDSYEFNNLISCRAVMLTLLYQAITDYKSRNGFLNISCREAIIHMLYEDSGMLITSLNQIAPSLALKILNPRFAQADASASPDFGAVVKDMNQWFAEHREWVSTLRGEAQDLPELEWHALPKQLFGLTRDK